MDRSFISPNQIKGALKQLEKEYPTSSLNKPFFFNILYFAPTPLALLSELLRSIPTLFPCRVIEIALTAHEEEVKFSLNLDISPLAQGVVSENLKLHLPPEEFSNVMLHLFPLLVPDLPTVLLWGEDPAEHNILFKSMTPWIQRLILNPKSVRSLSHFVEMVEMHVANPTFEWIDLQWTMGGGWREAFRKTFDTAERIALLSSPLSVKFFHAGTCVPPLDALYLQGWLASSLSWELETCHEQKQSHVLRYRSQTLYHTVELIEIPSDSASLPHASQSGLRKIEIKGRGGEKVLLNRKEDDSINVHVDTPEQCDLPFLLPPCSSPLQELLYRNMSELYVNSLKKIRNISWRRS